MENNVIKNITVSSMTNLGAGVGKDTDGTTLFINGAARGDVCDCEVIKSHKSYKICKLNKLISPSDERIKPDCDSYSDGCGGCAFRHVGYEHELRAKHEYVTSLFRRAGLGTAPDPIRTAGGHAARTKVTVPVSSDGEIGYYREGTHKIMPCRTCRLHDELTNAILSSSADMIASATVYGMHHITVRRGSGGVMVIYISDDERDVDFSRTATKLLRQKYTDITSVYFCLRENDATLGKYVFIAGDKRISDRLTGCDFLISPGAFYQVNHDAAEILYTLAAEYADIRDGETLADLYCGTGTIGISVIKNSAANARLFGIEIVPSAVEDARLNAKNNGVTAAFVCADAATYDSGADCVIVDPPRAGCDKRLIAHLLTTLPPRIVYISCDPATLVRDLRLLQEKYDIKKATPVDMFPRTGHVECVVCLSKKTIISHGQPSAVRNKKCQAEE